MHRIFIAINLPEKIKNKLAGFQEKWPDLPCQWTKKENLHITLLFLGSLNDEEVFEVCKITKEIGSRNKDFIINLNKTCYGPSGKDFPRMVWIKGEKVKELSDLKNDLERGLVGKVKFIPDKREFSPHITLGRIRMWDFRRINPEDRPKIEQDISLSFRVSSIEVMESQLKRSGAEYTILETCNLKHEI